MTSSWVQQEGFTVRFEWGMAGARELTRLGDVVVVCDVLSFSTTVSVAMDRGIRVVPSAEAEGPAGTPWPVAVRREAMDGEHPYSLSPEAFRVAPFTSTVVLPSPNGATISAMAAAVGANVLAGCIRNARATAIAALRSIRGTDPAGQRRRPVNTVLVIAAGERWPDGSLRPAIEDLLGAGAVIAELIRCGVGEADCSPEALVAMRLWNTTSALDETLLQCASGRELLLRGFGADVHIALEHNQSAVAALLVDDAFTPLDL